jgi:hypothetical protein
VWDLFAYLLICLPLPAPPQAPAPLWDALVRVSLALELADPRESWARHRPDGFAWEVECVRRRSEQLAGAPPLSDHYLWLAAAGVADDLRAFNRVQRGHLAALCDSGLAGHRRGDVEAQLAELDALDEAWGCAQGCACREAYVTTRRLALARLRELVGPENYLRGTMPPPVLLLRGD